MKTNSLTGTCNCESVAFTVPDEFEYSMICHCSQCRRATGSAFKPFAGIRGREKVRITKGSELLLLYGDKENHDVRCGRCGSLLFSSLEGGRRFHVALGSLVHPPAISPSCHIYVGSKAPWYEITDGLPQYAELPGGP